MIRVLVVSPTLREFNTWKLKREKLLDQFYKDKPPKPEMKYYRGDPKSPHDSAGVQVHYVLYLRGWHRYCTPKEAEYAPVYFQILVRYEASEY